MLHVIRGRRQPVAKQVLEEELAEPAARLRRPQRLLEPREVLCPLEHLRGGLVDLAEALVDLVRRLGRALEAAIHLRIELAETPVHRLRDALQAPVYLGVAIGELRAPVGPELTQDARQPRDRAAERDGEDQNQNGVCHRTDRR